MVHVGGPGQAVSGAEFDSTAFSRCKFQVQARHPLLDARKFEVIQPNADALPALSLLEDRDLLLGVDLQPEGSGERLVAVKNGGVPQNSVGLSIKIGTAVHCAVGECQVTENSSAILIAAGRIRESPIELVVTNQTIAGNRLHEGNLRLFPLVLFCTDIGFGQGRFVGLDGGFQFILTRFLRRSGELQVRLSVTDAAIQTLLRNIIEERKKPVEIALRNRIVLVIVAAGTAHRKPEPGHGGCFQTIHDVFHLIFLRNRAALEVNHVVAVKATGELLFGRRVRQQVTGQLLHRELVVRHVAIEGGDDPIAPVPGFAMGIDVIAVRIGVPGKIQPLGRHPLPVARRRQKRVNPLLVSVGGFVGEEGINLSRCGWQPGQIIGNPAQQSRAVGLGRGLQLFFFEAGQYEIVNRRLRPTGSDGGRVMANGSGESPVRLPFRTFIDPFAERFHLLRRQSLAGTGRRHAVSGGRGCDTLQNTTLLRLSRRDNTFGKPAAVRDIKAQVCHAFGRVGAMTGKTVFRENRPDFAIKIDSREGGEG